MIRKALFALALPLAACTTAGTGIADAPTDTALPTESADMPGPADGVYPSIMAVKGELLGTEGTRIGTVRGQLGPNGFMLQVEVEPGGLAPGWHGLHLHQTGDCSDTGEFKLSGGHVGKVDGGHGLLNPKGPEGGDLPNIWASADGAAGYEAFSMLLPSDAFADEDGVALIIHEDRDDHLSQPIGGAGARVACAVVR